MHCQRQHNASGRLISRRSFGGLSLRSSIALQLLGTALFLGVLGNIFRYCAPFYSLTLLLETRSRVDELLQELSVWELRELRNLQAALGGLIEALDTDALGEEGFDKEDASSKRDRLVSKKRGHTEEKYIPRGKKLHWPYCLNIQCAIWKCGMSIQSLIAKGISALAGLRLFLTKYTSFQFSPS